MRKRLRPAYSPEELRRLYSAPHDYRRWPDHHLRVNVTIQVAKYLGVAARVADLSCGAGIIATSLGAHEVILGDFAPGYGIHGPLEETIDQIPKVDLFLCCETLEHLDDPDAALLKIREKAHALVLSTPEGETTDENPEHYWGWDSNGVKKMLREAGFTPAVHTVVGVPERKVAFQIWGCR